MKIFKRPLAACALLGSVAMTVGFVMPAAHAQLAHPAVVSDNPADTTPHIVLSDSSHTVNAFAQVGSTMYAGGRFAQVEDPARTTIYPRQNFVAFDAVTGVVSPFTLSFDGLVTAIVASADGTALYISGAFAKVNGITRRGLVKYDLVNNVIDPIFRPTAANRTVSDIKLANGSLIAVGNFTKKVVAVDPTTGADTGSIDITVAGVVDSSDETRVRRMAISPDGTRLVATGNFTTVNGQSRKRAFSLNLGATATLSTWHAPRFDVNCNSHSRQVSAQGVDFSPDGTYFVIVSTGGPTGTNGVCDATARFDTANVSENAEPTWINWTGGDTLYSVAITGAAVYVGGHQRWLDNPLGDDSAGPGAVSRPGIGAIDPVTGKALAWNPTKSRNHGTTVLFATPSGLWVGSDGTKFGREYHSGIGFAPLDLSPTPDRTRPNTFIDVGPSGTVIETSAFFTFSATEPATFQCRLDGAAFAPCTSPATYSNLSATTHSFEVAATDASFNVDATPAARSWTVSEHAPVANAQSLSIAQDTTTSVTLTGSDPDNDPLRFKVTSLPDDGNLYDGTDTSGHLIGASELPYALSGTGDVATYQPDAGFAGADSFAVVANDGQLDSAPATVSIAVGASTINLIGNPGFESNTSGWQTEASSNSLSRVAGGHSGSWAAQLSNSSAGATCGLDDKPSWVTATQAGAYTAGIWVRSDTPGLTFKLRLREYRSGVLQGSVSTSVPLTSSWQQVTVVYTPVTPGQSSFDFEGFTTGAPVGVCFQADDASIVH